MLTVLSIIVLIVIVIRNIKARMDYEDEEFYIEQVKQINATHEHNKFGMKGAVNQPLEDQIRKRLKEDENYAQSVRTEIQQRFPAQNGWGVETMTQEGFKNLLRWEMSKLGYPLVEDYTSRVVPFHQHPLCDMPVAVQVDFWIAIRDNVNKVFGGYTLCAHEIAQPCRREDYLKNGFGSIDNPKAKNFTRGGVGWGAPSWAKK